MEEGQFGEAVEQLDKWKIAMVQSYNPSTASALGIGASKYNCIWLGNSLDDAKP